MALTKVSRGLLTTSIVDNGNATAITIDSNENVGIGGVASNSSGYTTLNLNNATNGGLLTFQNNGTAKGYIYNSSSQFRIESAASAPLVFANETGETMRITSAGLVGIGTSTPDTTLHLQTPSGTKSEINFAQTAVTNYRIGVPASTDALVFTYGASTERIRLNSAGSVGINNPNPAQTLSICNPANPNRNGMEIAIGAGDTSSNTIQNYNRATGVYTPLNIVGSILTFGAGTSAIERMRLTASGSLKVKGPESAYISTSEYHEFSVSVPSIAMYVYNSNASAGAAGILINVNNEASDANGYFLRGYSNSATRDNFYVYSNGNVVNRNNSFGTLSDQKLKQDIVDANNQWEDFKAIKFRKFRFKDDVIADPNTPHQLGVVAQELEAAGLNGLVSESPDKEFYQETVTDDDGNDVLDEDGNAVTEQKERLTGETTKSVKMSILYAKGMVALQEAMERIETLEARLTALENN